MHWTLGYDKLNKLEFIVLSLVANLRQLTVILTCQSLVKAESRCQLRACFRI